VRAVARVALWAPAAGGARAPARRAQTAAAAAHPGRVRPRRALLLEGAGAHAYRRSGDGGGSSGAGPGADGLAAGAGAARAPAGRERGGERPPRRRLPDHLLERGRVAGHPRPPGARGRSGAPARARCRPRPAVGGEGGRFRGTALARADTGGRRRGRTHLGTGPCGWRALPAGRARRRSHARGDDDGGCALDDDAAVAPETAPPCGLRCLRGHDERAEHQRSAPIPAPANANACTSSPRSKRSPPSCTAGESAEHDPRRQERARLAQLRLTRRRTRSPLGYQRSDSTVSVSVPASAARADGRGGPSRRLRHRRSGAACRGNRPPRRRPRLLPRHDDSAGTPVPGAKASTSRSSGRSSCWRDPSSPSSAAGYPAPRRSRQSSRAADNDRRRAASGRDGSQTR
jgi:hypothetical protein